MTAAQTSVSTTEVVGHFASPTEEWTVCCPPQGGEDVTLAALERAGVTGLGARWVSSLQFMCNGVVGSMLLDTGAGATVVSAAFAARAALVVRAPEGALAPVRVANGDVVSPSGVVDVPLFVQLILDLEGGGQCVHWDRHIVLRDVWVLDLGQGSPRDLYVSWADWAFAPAEGAPTSPLGGLAALLASGARVLDTPRVPAPSAVATVREVAVERRDGGGVRGGVVELPLAAVVSEPDLADQIRARVPEGVRGTPVAARLVALLLAREKLFGPLVSAECTEVVEFELVGQPQRVSFRVPVTRRAQSEDAFASLREWEARGICERVSWDTDSYGFAIVVPKPGGKFRVTMNPTGINSVTAREDPQGGYMPDSMVMEALSVGGQRVAVTLDLKEAFLMFQLGPEAQRLSTFTTPIGKMRWKHGWFGWHSFPARFQRMMMERVVLPTLDDFPGVTFLCWVDDLVLAARDADQLMSALGSALDRVLALGGRLSLAKCNFLVTRFDWCGVEVDLLANQWRVEPSRVASLLETPVPEDREALRHVLGVLRYYFFGVSDQLAQRERLALLSELDVVGIRLRDVWTDAHTVALRGAMTAVATGAWALVFDARQPVYVTTDASGNHGFGVVANQFDGGTGLCRPISYFSRGWASTQLTWTPQVKECYAQWYAVTTVMRKQFPYASVVLLCDNKNLATHADSADARVVRWQQNIRDAGCDVRYWIPGEWNTIADYASRSVRARPDAALSAEEAFEMHIYGLMCAGGEAQGASTGGGAWHGASAPPTTPLGEASAPAYEGRPRDTRPPRRAATRGPSIAATRQGRAGRFWGEGGGPGPHGGPGDSRDGVGQGGDRADADVDAAWAGDTVVPGHVALAPMAAKIAAAQGAADESERASWAGARYSVVTLGGRTLHLFKDRLIVPRDAEAIKGVLLRMAHDDEAHYLGAARTLKHLVAQARVHWAGMAADVEAYVRSCFRCQFAKPAAHGPTQRGELTPTLAPHVNHTWYVDLKDMPHGTGHIMAVVEPITRLIRLRYLPNGTAREVVEELEEVIWANGTRPVVLRSDGGPPFNSSAFAAFCAREGIRSVLGVPYHSQGQGAVETRFRPIAAAIMATLGHKAPREWWRGRALAHLEGVINSSVCEPLGGSPTWAATGREPRTRLSAACDWTHPDFGQAVLGLEAATANDVAEIVAAHHAQLNAVQGRAMLASSLAQALTKRAWDASRERGDFTVGEWVLVHRTAPNRMLPHFTGPYQIDTVSADGNFATVRHYLGDGAERSQIHVSRLLHFDMSRASKDELVAFQLDSDSDVVGSVIEHRMLGDGSMEFHLRWVGTPVTSWLPGWHLRRVEKVREYCTAHGLPSPWADPRPGGVQGTANRAGRSGMRRGRGRARGRGSE